MSEVKKFAELYWVAQDVVDGAEELGIKLTIEEAEEILKLKEDSLTYALAEYGTEILTDYLYDNYETSEVEDD